VGGGRGIDPRELVRGQHDRLDQWRFCDENGSHGMLVDLIDQVNGSSLGSRIKLAIFDG